MSRIVAVCPVRNEAWCAGLSLRALLMWVDHLIVCQHCCTDATPDILSALVIEYGTERVSVITDTDSTWHEMSMRHRLLEAARMLDATHIITVDCDELLTGNLLPKIREWVESLPSNVIMRLPWLQLYRSIDYVIASGMWAQQNASMAFVDRPQLHWTARDGYDHHHREPYGMQNVCYTPMSPGNRTGGLMHLQMVSEQRLKWKQFHYLLTERLRWPDRKTPAELNAIYAPTVRLGSVDSVNVPASWWAPYADLMQYLDIDAEPWQRADALRIIKENPGIEVGLDDFGVLSSAHEAAAPSNPRPRR